jgi:hypothetical protein
LFFLIAALLLAPLTALCAADVKETLLSGAPGTPQAGVPASRPNIIFILTDDV